MRPLPAKIFGENIIIPQMNQNIVNGLIIFLSICAILFYGQQILIPIVLAILLSFLLSPLVRMLQKTPCPAQRSITSGGGSVPEERGYAQPRGLDWPPD